MSRIAIKGLPRDLALRNFRSSRPRVLGPQFSKSPIDSLFEFPIFVTPLTCSDISEISYICFVRKRERFEKFSLSERSAFPEESNSRLKVLLDGVIVGYASKRGEIDASESPITLALL